MPVQRWRLILARTAEGGPLDQRAVQAAWDDALVAAGLRDPGAPDPARFVPGASMPIGMTADAEPADLFLPERRAIADVRARLVANLPAGFGLVDIHDVWLGESALPGRVVAGDYLVDIAIAGDGATRGATGEELAGVERAVGALLGATTLERARTRPDRPTGGNLRPLISDVRLRPDGRLWMRLRFDPSLGTGRPEDVVAALGLLAGVPLEAVRRHRLRIWLKGESIPEGILSEAG